MKKIMWLFGQPGSGRKTLINNLLVGNQDIIKQLGIDSTDIVYGEIPYVRSSFDSELFNDKRRYKVLSSINSFSRADNDVLLLNGEFDDYCDIDNNVFDIIRYEHTNITQELLLLSTSDINLLYERLQATDWFQSKYDEHNRRFTMDWLRFASSYLKEKLLKYNEKGYTLYEIDTTDGYEVTKHLANHK